MRCRRDLDLPVRNEVDVTSIEWEDSLFRVAVATRDGNHAADDHVYARHVVLATGLEGNGEWQSPTHQGCVAARAIRACRRGDRFQRAEGQTRRRARCGRVRL